MISQGNLHAEKIAYPEQTWCCVWRSFLGDDNEDIGLCFDFKVEDLDDMIALLTELREIEAEIAEDE